MRMLSFRATLVQSHILRPTICEYFHYIFVLYHNGDVCGSSRENLLRARMHVLQQSTCVKAKCTQRCLHYNKTKQRNNTSTAEKMWLLMNFTIKLMKLITCEFNFNKLDDRQTAFGNVKACYTTPTDAKFGQKMFGFYHYFHTEKKIN